MKNKILSVFGLGYLPKAPGTWGSLLPVVLFAALGLWFGYQAVGWVMVICLGVSAFFTIWLSPKAIQESGHKDPRWIVSDELAGQSLTLLLLLSYVPELGFCMLSAVGFGLFRLFDILKPFPCRLLEKLAGGWGILADDLAAALWAAGIVAVGRNLNILEHLSGWFGGEGHLSIGLAVFLGTIQGLTEFLPVSSSGHLVLFESFVPNIQPQSPEMLLFDLVLHLGTVLAIVVVFKPSFKRFVLSLKSSLSQCQSPYSVLGIKCLQLYKTKLAIRFIVLGLVATIATGAGYGLFKDILENARHLRLLSLTWLASACLLYASEQVSHRKPLKKFGLLSAFVVGLFQAIAILPGISRSGATICAGLLLGLPVRWAIEFSFFIAIPAIVGATVVHTISHSAALWESGLETSYLISGFISSFITGYAALKLLVYLSRFKKLRYFAFYCMILGLLVAVYTL